MDKDVILKIEGLHKKFCRTLKRSMFYGSIDIVRNMLGIPYGTDKLRRNEFWALEDINLELKRGEVLGIIGQNGSGKTTLLRLISGIFPPDRGKITLKGRVGALISVGAGFHPHMTGRENIYLNGTILGMSKKDIAQKYDSIIDFADIGDFLDAPVSTYSSGMTVRLGFAIAIHCEPDILVVDEILSVGDLSFQNKSLRKIHELTKKVGAVIFISHNLDHIRTVSEKVMLLKYGKMVCIGNPDEVINEYYKDCRLISLKSLNNELDKNKQKYIVKSEDIEYLDAGILNDYSERILQVGISENINIYYDFAVCNQDITKPVIGIGIRDERNFNIVYESNLYNENKRIKLPIFYKGKKYRLVVKFKKPNLLPGIYMLNLGFRNGETFEHYQKIVSKELFFEIAGDNIYNFIVEGKKHPLSTIELESEWIVNELR